MSRTKSLFCVFFCLYFSLLLRAQTKEVQRPLTLVLTEIEERFSLQFNYALETLDSVNVTVPSKKISLKQTINYLRKETSLNFTVLSDNFISIKPKKIVLLCGYIKDLVTGKSITSATVQGQKKATISNDSGYFELEVNTIDEEIRIRYLGYKPLVRHSKFFKKEGCSNIYLIPQTEELSEIILTSFLTKGIDKLSNGAFQINFLDFGILPGQVEADVLQTVQALPGIQSVNETVSNINIRGGTNDQNLLLWDGIKMYQSGHFFGLISIYNPQITQHASLIKNGSAVDYTDGVSGTIVMESDRNVNLGLKGSLGLNFINADGFVNIPLGGKSSVQIGIRKALSDLVKTPTYDSYFKRILQNTEVETNVDNVINSDIKFDFYDVSMRWLWDIDENNHIRLNFLNVSNELVFNENTIVDSNEESRTSNLTQNSIAAGLYYERNWSDDFRTVFQIYETDYRLKAVNSNILESQRFLQENQVSESGAKLNTFYTIGAGLTLLNGYQFTETKITNLDDVDDPLFQLKVAEVVRSHGLYSQAIIASKNKQTNLNLGVRFNYLDKFDKYFIEPRISINQKLFTYFTLELLGEFKHQVTSQIINFQNDFLGIEKRRWQLANDNDIPVVQSKQGSVGLHLDTKGWLVSAEGYYKRVEGITTQSQGFQNQYEFSKVDGSYNVYGVDFLVQKQLNRFSTWLSYTYMDNQYTFDSLTEETFPNNLNIIHAINLGVAYSLNQFKVSGGFNWHSGRPTTRPIDGNEVTNQTINYVSANSSHLEDYFRVDISSTYQFRVRKEVRADLGVSVLNILDKKNPINNFYQINGAGAPSEELKTSLGITPNVSFRISF